MAQTTKKALAASLKKLIAGKPLDKITVIDIVEDCEVNRQTFYYHFKDIYDLVEWIYSSEATKALGNKKTYDTWQQGFVQVFQYILDNKALVTNTYHSANREHLQGFLSNECYILLMGVIEEKAAGLSVREDDKAFICNFYKYGFVGLIEQWIRTGMREDPSAIVERLSILIQGDIEQALKKFKKDKSLYK
ncbi:TetR/AcrR family transcriptional regulator [Clostridium omnivorum]|uniref:TetR family transcriptional regulator n=1 Tax=Clostridium omnivorum TaxID=1604902 RepID=A0ABQ5N8W9_9CLOT|nr:TetR/AcrR family transcriptional regulator [Clostridium sp. E14]GLC31640.1 TetR family transcriptional regulator [Clostridium sp. E14]